MFERFRHPPLVELVAEVRWGSGGSMAAGPVQPQNQMLHPTGQYEEFFMRFGSKVASVGFDLVERIVPPGFPTLPNQAIYRFRQKEQTHGTTIYQVGSGVFSANATPPYESWEKFRPVVSSGVKALLEARNVNEANSPFSSAGLRYINAFGPKFTQGLSTARFVSEVLGFKIEPPHSVAEEIEPNKDAKPFLQLNLPLKSKYQMAVMVAEGLVNGEAAVIMDIAVIADSNIDPTEEELMKMFDAAREVIHRVFVATTKSLSNLMELVPGEDR